MTTISQKHRIIFLDLMRAFAVLQMVQGHTTDVLLSDSFRNLDSPIFSFWLFMRGMTAPIFLFTAGTVFTYLFRLIDKPFFSNPRTKKGINRFLLLVILGYLLRYPTPRITDFSNVLSEQWKVFFAVDVLQLIGFGILFLMILLYLAEKLKTNDYLVLVLGALSFFLLSIFTQKINWIEFLPAPIAAYFYQGSGSNFPLFPWAGYVISGGILGSYLAKYPKVFKDVKFSIKLFLFGLAFVVIALIGDKLEIYLFGQSTLWTTSPNLIFLRIGIVLLLNSILSFISLKVDTIPKIVILIGRNTLLIYIVHLIILYGSAWNPGINTVFAKSFDVWKTIGAALLMILTMTGMVMFIHYLKIKNKQLVT